VAKTDYRSVDDYLAAQPPATRAVLERVRAAIRKAAPRAEETISYQVPAYRLDGGGMLWFAGWKEHVSLYPVSAAMIAELGDEIAPYVASKGTLRFPLSAPLPLRLIARIAKVRAAEAAKPRARKSAVATTAVAKSRARKSARPTGMAKKPRAKRGR
jgi:uncharacterized protein YdhG (YjbR/CyaY superfamily)